MKISQLKIAKYGALTEISANVDDYELWYRVPGEYHVSDTASPFLAAALLPAMLRGEKLEVDNSLSVSTKLLRNLSTLQEIHNCWNPIFKIIPIEAATRAESPLNYGVASFFSGGVDSTYTLLKHLEEISHLVFIKGFDFYYN